MTTQSNAPSSRDQLRSYRDRIVHLEEERAELAADIREIYAEAKSLGFDSKALRRIVKETMMDAGQRAAARETETIVEIYRANLGMLDGTPLGDAARQRFEMEAQRQRAREAEEAQRAAAERTKKRGKKGGGADGAASDGDQEAAAGTTPDSDATPAPEPQPEVTEAEAHAEGMAARKAGRRVTANPYGAGTRARAGWDEGWCEADGSDGMDIPAAWRRNQPAPGSSPDETEGEE